MRHYSIIVFDLGNVLIPFNYSLIIDKLNGIDKGLGNRFYERYKENYNIHREFEKSGLTKEEFLELMLQWAERKINPEEFCHIYSDIFTLHTDNISLLPRLKENYKLVLLSNTNEIHQEYGWKNYDFLKHFDKLILSHEVKAVKPEAEIYNAVENYTKHPPEKHIFIDDIVEYTEGALKAGWDAIHFTTHTKLLEELLVRGIKF